MQNEECCLYFSVQNFHFKFIYTPGQYNSNNSIYICMYICTHTMAVIMAHLWILTFFSRCYKNICLYSSESSVVACSHFTGWTN